MRQPRAPTMDMSNDPKKDVHPGDMHSGGHPHVGNFHVTRILYLSIKFMCIWRNSTMCLSEHRVQTCPHPVHHYVPKSCLATSLAYPSTHILHKVP